MVKNKTKEIEISKDTLTITKNENLDHIEFTLN